MIKLKPILYFAFLSLVFLNAKAQKFSLPNPFEHPQVFTFLDQPISSGIISGNFTITLADNGTVIRPGQTFKLTELGIVPSNRAEKKPDSYKDRGLKAYKDLANSPDNHHSFSFYKVKINRANDPITYYGLMSFYNAVEKSKDMAVTKYYEVKLSDNLFTQSRGGNLSYNYEFWKKSGQVVPTWIILFSDSEDLMWH